MKCRRAERLEKKSQKRLRKAFASGERLQADLRRSLAMKAITITINSLNMHQHGSAICWLQAFASSGAWLWRKGRSPPCQGKLEELAQNAPDKQQEAGEWRGKAEKPQNILRVSAPQRKFRNLLPDCGLQHHG